MTEENTIEDDIDIRNTITDLIKQKFGRIDENLITTGIFDSLKAVEFTLHLEKIFGLKPDCFSMADIQTISTLTNRVLLEKEKSDNPLRQHS